MKKIIALILAVCMVSMVAVLALNVQAEDEIITMDASTPSTDGSRKEVWGGNYQVTKKYFAASYSLVYTATAGIPTDDGTMGISIDASTNDGFIAIPYWPNSDKVSPRNAAGVVWFGPWWGDGPYAAKNVQVSLDIIEDLVYGETLEVVVYGSLENGTIKFKTAVNGQDIKSYNADEFSVDNSAGVISYRTRVTGITATFKFTQSDSPLGKDAFEEKAAVTTTAAPATTTAPATTVPATTAAPVTTAPTTTAPTTTEAAIRPVPDATTAATTEAEVKPAPETSDDAPKTGSTVALVAAIAGISLAGAAIAYKKKH